jgi:hypothetical protein
MAHTYYAGSGTHAYLELKAKLQAAGCIWLGWKAGRNYYEVRPVIEEAIIHGAHALRRWWIWIFFLNVWLGSTLFAAWMLWLRFHEVRGEGYPDISGDLNIVTRNVLMFLPVSLLSLLITYCRNVDFSLFKRRFVYRLLFPLVVTLDRVPNWLLYLIVFCPLFFPF